MVNGVFIVLMQQLTPGSHWEKNLLNKDGVAILKPGQYRGSHKIGLHQGRYEALKQQTVKVYRDNNRDGKYDLNEECPRGNLWN